MKRRGMRFVAILLSLGLILTALAGCAKQPEQPSPAQTPATTPEEPTPEPAEPEPKPLVKIKEAGFKVLYMWPQFIADEKGFFAAEGLDFEWVEVDSGALGVASLLSGDVQFTDMGINDAANLRKEGKEFTLVYQLVRRMTMDMVFRNEVADEHNLSRDVPLADRYKALKGLTIGITRPGAVTDVFARYYLQQAGLDPDKDATLVPVGGAGALAAALKTGQIDAYLLSPPSPHQLEQEGVGQIIIKSSAGDVPELANVPYACVTVTKEYAQQNPEVVRSYVRALQQSIAWATEHRDEALQIVGQYFQDTPAEVLALSWDAMLPAISPDGAFTEQGVKDYLTVMVQMGVLEEMPPTEAGVLWTNEFTQ